MSPNEDISASGQYSLSANIVLALRILLGTMSVVGLIGWGYSVLFFLAYYGRHMLAHWSVLIVLFPFVYLLLALFFSVRLPSLKTFFISGAVLNAPLVASFVYAVLHVEDQLRPGALVPIAYVLAWTCLGVMRWFIERHVSTLPRVITVAVLGGGLLLSATTVWPLMIDYRSEAQRYFQAAINANTADARSGFTEALRSATGIRRKEERIQFLGHIAVAQANRRLYEDSSETLKIYLDSDVENDDKERLFTSLTGAQIKNKDYGLALETARKLTSHQTLEIQYLSMEAVAAAETRDLEHATHILDVANTLANEQNESTRKSAFMHIADAQAKIGWHDAALNSAQRAGTENLIWVLGSMGVQEAERGYKESARHTMRVIHDTVDAAARDCSSRESVELKDRCLSELINKLGDAQFFQQARFVANKISSISKKDLALTRILDFEARFLNRDLEEVMTH
jgi:hypothetical protein